MMYRTITGIIAATLAAGCVADDDSVTTDTTQQPLAGFGEVTGFGSNPAQLKMYAYVPEGMPATPRPLVVAMHGCSMTASSYTGAGWQQLADLWKFYVVYPEQNSGVNNSLGCFNWGGSWPSAPNAFVFNEPLNTGELLRGQSENLSIKEMVDYMKQEYPVDANRVFASGVSAGGGMTAVMLATYPDVFAGGAIIAGIPYGCTIVPNATTQQGTDCTKAHPESDPLNRTPAQWAQLVHDAYPGYDGPYPVVSIWHGGLDFTVAPELQNELVEQWTAVHGVAPQPASSEQLLGATREVYRDGSGRVVVESYRLPNTQHTQPIDPSEDCGQTGPFISDEGICAAALAGELFGLEGDGDPGNPPGNPDAGPGGGGGGGGGGASDAGGAGADGDGRPAGCYCDGGGGNPVGGLLLAAACALVVGRRQQRRRRL